MLRLISFMFILLFPSLMSAFQKKTDVLITLLEGCIEAADKFDYQKENELAEELYLLASEQGNDYYQTRALFFLGISKLFTGKAESALPDLQSYLRKSLEFKNDTLIASAYNSLAIYEGMVNNNLNISQRYLLMAKDYAQKANQQSLINSIYNNLAEIARQQNDFQGEEYALRLFQHAEAINDKRLMFLGADHLAYFRLMNNDKYESRKYFNIAKSLQIENGFLNSNILNRTEILLNIEEGNIEEAEKNVLKYLDESHNLGMDDRLNALLLYAKVKNLKKDYFASNHLLSKMLQQLPNNEYLLLEEGARRLMAVNNNKLGLTSEALREIYKADSLSEIERNNEKQHLVNERKLMLSIIDHEQQERLYTLEMKHKTVVIWILSGAALLLLAIIFGIAVYFRKRDKLYKHLVANQKQILTLEEEAQDLRNEIIQSEIIADKKEKNLNETLTGVESEEENKNNFNLDKNKSEKIYLELCRLMEEEKLYRNPNFTREELIERLKTNRTYLSMIIKNFTGNNYSQFINSYRIKEAIKILSDPENSDFSLKKLSGDLGFVSPATFSKLFQQAVGMSPSNYRKSLIALESI